MKETQSQKGYKIVRIYEDSYKKILADMKKNGRNFIKTVQIIVDSHEKRRKNDKK